MQARASATDGGRGAELAALAVVPARLGSTRLPRKMLLKRTGTYIFAHTAERVQACAAIARVVVAVDSDEVLAAARACGLDAVMTRTDHPSGTDRVHEAAGLVDAPAGGWDVVLNVQGDEPDVDPDDLARLVAAFRDPAVEAATPCAPIADPALIASPAVVKLARDGNGDALYFSRSPIPARTHARDEESKAPGALRHIGVYAWRPDALARFCALPPGVLERAENLEQLRWLEAGNRMRTVDAAHVPHSIDTQEDYDRFVNRVAALQRGGV
jgi:3-deoxy-manno-octulosonate cytidylyltransferase (CMP-KDO synthetase)